MGTLRALIVDDEPLARRGLRMMLSEEPDVEIVAECASGPEAVARIREEEPNLVLLDIQMPEMDGFEVIQRIGPARMPITIFVTAYDQHALRAFDAHALDYVLKPIVGSRFQEALRRARDQLRLHELGDLRRQVRALLREMQSQSSGDASYAKRLVVKEAGRVFFLPTDEIDWIETAGNYVKLHTREGTHLLRTSMTSLEDKLDPNLFLRIRRSKMVNTDRIKELRPVSNGEYIFVLKDEKELTSSRRYRSNLNRLLGE